MFRTSLDYPPALFGHRTMMVVTLQIHSGIWLFGQRGGGTNIVITTAPLTGPSRHSDHPLGRTPRPPRPVCPVLGDYCPSRRPIRTLRPPLGQDSPSPQAGVPGSWGLLPPSQAHQDTPTTPWAGLPVPPGRCARFLETTTPLAGPSGHSDHPVGRTPRPPRLVCPVLGEDCRWMLKACAQPQNP